MIRTTTAARTTMVNCQCVDRGGTSLASSGLRSSGWWLLTGSDPFATGGRVSHDRLLTPQPQETSLTLR